MTMLIKLLSLALFTAAVVLFSRTMFEPIAVRWNRRIATYAGWIALEFQSMYDDMSIDRARFLVTACVVGGFVFGFLLGGAILQRLFIGVVFAGGGYFGPWLAVAHLKKRRLQKIDDQLIDALRLMSNALRSGLSLQQALELVVREMNRPIADEFGRLVKEIHLGHLTDDALRRFALRLPLEDVQLVVESVLTLRETGGNLSETFQVIATTIVERKKVYGKIRAMTTQGMTQGGVVCLMPIALMLLFSLIDPNYMRPFFATPLGWMMMILVFVLDGIGLWLMVKLVKVDI
jgi:tight adherence protein B